MIDDDLKNHTLLQIAWSDPFTMEITGWQLGPEGWDIKQLTWDGLEEEEFSEKGTPHCLGVSILLGWKMLKWEGSWWTEVGWMKWTTASLDNNCLLQRKLPLSWWIECCSSYLAVKFPFLVCMGWVLLGYLNCFVGKRKYCKDMEGSCETHMQSGMFQFSQLFTVHSTYQATTKSQQWKAINSCISWSNGLQ